MSDRMDGARLRAIHGFCLVGLVLGSNVAAQSVFVPEAQIVLVSPSDCRPPPRDSYRLRLHQFELDAEQFFHEGYRGSGNSKDGGWAVLNYTNLPGAISLRSPMVSRFRSATV